MSPKLRGTVAPRVEKMSPAGVMKESSQLWLVRQNKFEADSLVPQPKYLGTESQHGGRKSGGAETKV